MAVQDILIDESRELVIGTTDFDVGESDQQHVEHILVADSGHFRQHPTLGVGIDKNINASLNRQELKQNIKLQLKNDNYQINQVIVTKDFEISIDAIRIK